MSGSFYVYGPKCLSLDELAAVAAEATGWQTDVVSGGLKVHNIDRQGYHHLYEVGECYVADPEDMNIEVDFGDVIWGVIIEVYSDDAVTDLALLHAITRAMDGVSCGDDGLGIWPEGKAVQKDLGGVETGKRLLIPRPAHKLKLYWFGLDRGGVCLPRVPFDHAVGPLAGLVPQSYSLAGPDREFANGGVDKMCAALDSHRSAPDAMFRGSGPPFGWCFVSTSLGEATAGGAWSMEVSAHAQAFRKARMRDCLRQLFTGVADETGAVYAYAEVTAGYLWDGCSLEGVGWFMFSGVFPPESYPHMWHGIDWGRGAETGFYGLTPRPTWWAWFGSEYLPLVSDRLSHAPRRWRVSDTEAGVLVQLASKPTRWKGLQSWVHRRLKTPWMPPELISWDDDTPAKVRPTK